MLRTFAHFSDAYIGKLQERAGPALEDDLLLNAVWAIQGQFFLGDESYRRLFCDYFILFFREQCKTDHPLFRAGRQESHPLRVPPDDPDAGPLQLKQREIILVDDVIFTGRTVKIALSMIFRSARPRSVRLAVLIDRGHRQVPVKPNYVGKHIPSSEWDRVRVRLRELDSGEHDQAVIFSIQPPGEEPRAPRGRSSLSATH